jgi:general secretion pathway protein L
MKISLAAGDLVRTFYDALHWWCCEMGSLLPERAKVLFRKRQILVTVEGPTLHFQASRDENGRSIHAVWSQDGHDWLQFDDVEKLQAMARDTLVSLQVPEHLVLRQRITLPLAAKRNLQEAIAYGLSTWSPFTTDEVAVAARIASSDGQQVSADLQYVLRSQLSSLIEKAAELGFAPDRLVFDLAGEWSTPIEQTKSRRLDWNRRIDMTLAASAVALLLVLPGTLVWRQNMELSLYRLSLRDGLELWKKEDAERKRLDELAARQTVFVRNRNAHPAMVDIIRVIGDRLPASSFMTSLDLSDGKGAMVVEGAEASDLLQALQAVQPLSDIKFAPAQAGRPVTVTFKIEKGQP